MASSVKMQYRIRTLIAITTALSFLLGFGKLCDEHPWLYAIYLPLVGLLVFFLLSFAVFYVAWLIDEKLPSKSEVNYGSKQIVSR